MCTCMRTSAWWKYLQQPTNAFITGQISMLWCNSSFVLVESFVYSNFRTTKLFAVVVVDAAIAAAADDDDDDAVFNRLFENDDERSSSSSSSSSSLLLLLLFNSSLSFRGRLSDDDDIGLVILNSADLESNMTLLILNPVLHCF